MKSGIERASRQDLPASGVIRLRVAMLSEVLVSMDALRVRADGVDGSFCLLPKHIDWVSPLREGVLEWTDTEGMEHYAVHESGLLVKTGPEVMVSVRAAARGDDLSNLPGRLTDEQERLDARAVRARTALMRLETSLVRRFIDYREGRRV